MKIHFDLPYANKATLEITIVVGNQTLLVNMSKNIQISFISAPYSSTQLDPSVLNVTVSKKFSLFFI